MKAGLRALTILMAIVAVPAAAGAQTAVMTTYLGNFDIINNTGEDAHGFEIQFEGITANDVWAGWSYERYGAPEVTQTPTGVSVRYASGYDSAAQQFATRTVPYAGGAKPFAGTCYMGSVTYDASGCEHFGISTMRQATRATFRWLLADPQNPGALIGVDPPTAVVNPTYAIVPPATAGAAPALVAEVQAPEPAETPEVYGDAQWMKVFKTQLDREVALEELMSDNPMVPQDAQHVETEWAIIQTEPATGGTQRRQRKQNQGGLDTTTRSVVRRYELYAFTGSYDPITHEALCADGLCNAPSADELGDFISAQMAAANVVVPSITASVTGSGQIASSDKAISCGNTCTEFATAGAPVTLTASASSGSIFTGWSGGCAGTTASCALVIDQNLNVGATFAKAFTLSIGRSNKGTVASDDGSISCGTVNQKGISSCSAKFAQAALVTLTATPPAGASFLSWGGACSGTAPTCQVVMTKDTSVQANFSK
jgi:List-Bact-rpt repeat protein